MPLPKPKVALNNACSVIFNNTLYVYTPDAFQSLRLEPGAEWKTLPHGEKVTGGVCVGAHTGVSETSSFWVVGGIGTSEDYHGLQKFTYSTGTWETIKLPEDGKVTHQRQGHAAVYLNATDSILVYGGSQDLTTNPSSQTYTIRASAPYTALAHDGAIAPPSSKPILLPWSTYEAVLVGGSTWNTQVMLFNGETGVWQDSGATLLAPLPKDTSAIQGALLTGDDGSKNLITFDASVSPNLVQRHILYTAPGQPVINSVPVRRRSSRRMARRAEPLTLQNWPAYNSTLAPTTTRSNYALAQGPDGMIVIAGGNEDDVLCMFDAKQNSWQDANQKLGQFRLLSSDTTSSTVSTTKTTAATVSTLATSVSSTASPTGLVTATTAAETATSTPDVRVQTLSGDGKGPSVNTVLGAVLGGFFGLAAILAAIYFVLRRKKLRESYIRRTSGEASNEKDGVGFSKDTYNAGTVYRGGRQYNDSQNSFSSMAILMGHAEPSKPRLPPLRLGRKGSSSSRRKSSTSTFKDFKAAISKPILHEVQSMSSTQFPPRPPRDDTSGSSTPASNGPEPRPRNLTGVVADDATRRSSGWNRYWSGGSALNILGFGSGNKDANLTPNPNGPAGLTPSNISRPTTFHSESGSSHYSDPHRMTRDSATVPPLQVFTNRDHPRMSFSRVRTQSPTIEVPESPLHEGMSVKIEGGPSNTTTNGNTTSGLAVLGLEEPRPVSAMTYGSASQYSSGIPESVAEAWDPTATSSSASNSRDSNKPWGDGRPYMGFGGYPTPLAPASAARAQQTLQQGGTQPRRNMQEPVRDDMSWLNLNAS